MMPTETLLKKSQIIDSFQDLPEQVSADELIERILFFQAVERGLQQVSQGKTIPHEQVMQELRELREKKKAALQESKA